MMSTQTETNCINRRSGADLHGSEEAVPVTSKEKWLQKYASRILMVWSHWQTPLGVPSTYMGRIKKDLARFYEDPLKRMFIEATY
jgi:hypothetical protein